jgi:4-methyl-5(b-hydroxyethyl)-thiazole monophosphate biosynthesis
MLKAVVIFANGFEEVEAVTPVDFLARAGIEVTSAGVGGKKITGAHGFSVNVDCEIGDVQNNIDCLVIPGGSKGALNIAASEKAIKLIRDVYNKGKLVGAICAAPAIVLPKTGIIEGKKMTCFPGLEDKLIGALFSEDRVVTDGNLVTSRAAGTAAEFSITLVELLAGKKAADTIRTGTLQK